VLLESVSSTNRSGQPLLVWQHYGRGTTYMLGTASTWRWKMRLPHDDQRHFTFWRQLLHTVAGDAPSRLTLTSTHKVYDDERRVAISAELHNEKFEPVNDATVELTLTSDEGVTTADAPGLYRLDMKATNGKTEVGSLQTHIRRNDGIVEHFGTAQNRPLLQRIADSTG